MSTDPVSESVRRPDKVEHFDCEGCGKPTSTGERGFLWFFGKPYCPECRESIQHGDWNA